MSQLLWPDTVLPFATDMQVQDSNARSQSAITGVTRVVGRPGSRLKMSMQFRALTERKRALLRRLIAASRGGTNPFWVRDHSYTQAGSMSAADLIANPTFENGTTGFSTGSSFSIAAQDRVIRATRSVNSGGTDGFLRITSAVTVTPYQPYVGRCLVVPGRGPYSGLRLRFGSSGFGAEYTTSPTQEAGMITYPFVPYDATLHFGVSQGAAAGIAGDYLDIPFISLAPCALVDNGPNLLSYSSDLSNAAWTKDALSVASTSVTLPNGSTGTVNTLKEDSTAGAAHSIAAGNASVTGAVQDFCAAVAVKKANRTWVRVAVRENTSSTQAELYVNLATGAKGTAAAGANWASLRTFVYSMGNDWYYIAVVARNTNSATSFTLRLHIAEADNDATFNGGNQDSLYVWRPTLAQSSVPVRLTGTSGTALASGTTQDLGGGLYTKGWPASTAGLLLAGDQVEIDGQLFILAGSVDSDAAGKAWLPIPSMRKAPADKAPVIINRPMAKWIPVESENGWMNALGGFSDAELQLVEAA